MTVFLWQLLTINGGQKVVIDSLVVTDYVETSVETSVATQYLKYKIISVRVTKNI